MKKDWKEIFFILPAVILAFGVVLGFRLNMSGFVPVTYHEKEVVNEPTKESEKDSYSGNDNSSDNNVSNSDLKNDNSKDNVTNIKKLKYTKEGTWKDGTYTGSGTGFGGLIEVCVTISNSEITDIQIISCEGETQSYLKKAIAVIERIITAQSPDVDMVSGATYSSNGICTAVIQALNKAGGNLKINPLEKNAVQNNEKKSSNSKKKENNSKNKKSADGNGKPADGVYSGSAVCEQFGYTINLKTRFKSGKAVSIYGLKITGNKDKANKAYWEKAWKPMVKRILKTQNTDVDAVSGATYSSNAILEAYQNARLKAVGTEKSKDKKNKTDVSPSPVILLPDDNDNTQATENVKDGIYLVSAVCEPDQRMAFSAYTLMADVTFEGGKCISIDNFSSTDESNKNYYLKAANGTTEVEGVVAQILKTQSVSGISAVSGATCSSKTIRELYIKALNEAGGAVKEDIVDDSETSPENTPSLPPMASPTPGLPQTSSLPENNSFAASDMLIKDGVYTASAIVAADEWEEFADYNLTADVTFAGGKLVGIDNMVPEDTSNQGYCNLAANGYGSNKGVIQQLIDRQNGDVDAVSGATCSSLALVQIYKNALEMAMGDCDENIYNKSN